MTEFKIDPSKYAHLSPEEAKRQMAEDERRAINEDPQLQAYVRDMERRQAQERAEEQKAAVRLEGLEQKKFDESLDGRYRDRLEFYRHKGVPRETFDKEVWPKLKQQFVIGEEDAVDRERRERSTSVY